ncbi:MAG: hypothetical protein MK198_07435 [Gracilimonas sp.]|uniref:hypothetical protein n=1 Tax=Gracilimonas sp. TaxID=1974203 RepID=UPI0037534BCA|nr:hypothetical protein [Gracilimonas sp.]
MSIEDLKDQGILLPEKEWGEHNLTTTVSKIPIFLLFIFSVLGCLLTFLGEGKFWTWIGIILFFCSFFGVIILCDRAIVNQRKRTKREKQEIETSES